MVEKVLIEKIEKKLIKLEYLNLRKLPVLYITYLALKILFIIASIVINHEKKFGVNCSKTC